MWKQYSAILMAAGILVGCGGGDGDVKEGVTDADKQMAADDEAHHAEHAHEAPHGGHLIELGEHEYNLEVCFDDSKKLTLYVLDAHAENAVAIAPSDIEFEVDLEGGDEVEIELTPEPLEGESAEKASVFVAEGNEELAKVESIEELHAHVHITIEGKEFTPHIEHDHDEEGHHDDDDDDEEDHKDGDDDE